MNPGNIVQLHPTKTRNPMFAGCLAIVSEVSGSGRIMVYVQTLGKDEKPGGQAYYFVKPEEISPVIGQAYWVVGEE